MVREENEGGEVGFYVNLCKHTQAMQLAPLAHIHQQLVNQKKKPGRSCPEQKASESNLVAKNVFRHSTDGPFPSW